MTENPPSPPEADMAGSTKHPTFWLVIFIIVFKCITYFVTVSVNPGDIVKKLHLHQLSSPIVSILVFSTTLCFIFTLGPGMYGCILPRQPSAVGFPSFHLLLFQRVVALLN